MAKKGMRRPDPAQPHGTESNKKAKTNSHEAIVPEMHGKSTNRNDNWD